MKNLVITICSIVSLLCNVHAQYEKEYYLDGSIAKDYQIEDGVFNGVYISYHLNGQKKAEGYFENNQRFGEWSVWDTTGQLRMKRLYQHQYSFSTEEIYDAEGKLLLESPYDYKKLKGENGYEYTMVPDSSHLWSKNNWKSIPLATENLMLLIVMKNAVKNGAKVYKADDLKEELTGEITDTPLKEYKIKERVIYDKHKKIMEVQLLAIAPCIENEELFWLDFNSIRKGLNDLMIESEYEFILTVDDYFVFHQFKSEIYKESNVYDRMISDYKNGQEIEKESNKIAAGIIEAEHDFWLYEAGYQKKQFSKSNK